MKLQLRYVPIALVPNRGSDLIEKTIILTDDWERYSFDVRLPLQRMPMLFRLKCLRAKTQFQCIWMPCR